MKAQSGYSAGTAARHVPVMLQEVLACLSPKDGETYVDGTFGAGGYTRAILDAAKCTVHAIDRDPSAAKNARDLAQEYPGKLFAIEGRFGDMRALIPEQVDGIVLDIGVSSMQIDEAERGFSFRNAGPLDMRMESKGESAADVVNTAGEKELADIIFMYGEERAARRIAKRICEARGKKRIETTKELAEIVHAVLPMHGGHKTDTATRTFQALRIFVNDELGELDRALKSAEDMLKPGGRLVVVSFHSLEDGRVKDFLRERSGRAANVSRHMPQPKTEAAAFRLEKSSALKASDEETAANPRARSARLRWAVRTETEAAHG
jgi:16S rRNA (cytosine1402-N4)-methyltransferase